MMVYTKICFEACTNDQYIWHKNNIAQLYFIPRTAKLSWNFSSTPKDVTVIHLFSNRNWVLTYWKSLNIKDIPKSTGNFLIQCQCRIQDFPEGGAPTPKRAIIFHFFPENCMKMKEFGPGGVPGVPLGSANVHIKHNCAKLFSTIWRAC